MWRVLPAVVESEFEQFPWLNGVLATYLESAAKTNGNVPELRRFHRFSARYLGTEIIVRLAVTANPL
jgi:hypothetical protein